MSRLIVPEDVPEERRVTSLSALSFRERWRNLFFMVRRFGEMDALEREWMLNRLREVHADLSAQEVRRNGTGA